MRSILLGASQLILEALGYDTYLGEYTLGIVNQGGIRLVYECLGFELTFGYIALVSAYPFQGKRSWGYLILGIILIQLLNVVRIFGLTILFATQKASAFEIVDHHDLFNLAVIIVLIIAYWRFLPKEGAK
ncbi:MAG: archaeosortase/exosortase family protein [Bacteroidota bacterium]